ncbi:MAG TPA: NADP-dependent oxidoreductase [Pyrinomonadaceae bacterium]|nr:NADP-dependent oxidoreductase [Pyrinomonadaceae bacterium]
MSTLENRHFKLAARPAGMVRREDFEFAAAPVGSPGPGEVLVRVRYVSIDPAMRAWMNETPSYMPPVGLGEVMRAFGAGRVVASNDASLSEGDEVTGLLGVQDYAVVKASGLNRVDTNLAPLPRHLGALGVAGMTAYFGLLEVGRLREGETVVVSGAAGAVGGLVGQMAKLKGCRAVGVAGGAEKCRYLVEELGFDAAVDYKAASPALPHLYQSLKADCPRGVDVFFDNVGGDVLDAALLNLARGARVVICGGISQYNNAGTPEGPKFYLSLLVNRASMQGFLVFDYAARYAEAAADIAGWLASGKLKAREDVEEGLENFPDVLLKLFRGGNLGKLVLKVSD